MKKICCFDPGHGGNQPGAVYRGLAEKDVVLKVTMYASKVLVALDPNVGVVMTRTGDYTKSLEDRCLFSNAMRANCFISIHCNADPDEDLPGMPEAKGEEIYIYDDSVEGMKLAKCLADGVDKIFPNEPFRGIKKTRPIGADKSVDKRPFLYVVAHTDAPACLAEIGFIDKSSSIETFTDEETLKKIGQWIAEGAHEYLKSAG
jgi:N-acetylmuramoyl-L-alanine amidase